MTRAQIEALAARVEAAQGADPTLGAEVLRACGWKQREGMLSWWSPAQVAQARKARRSMWSQQPIRIGDPTASLDAAASLVPEGWIRRNSEIRGAWLVQLWKGDVSFRKRADAEGCHAQETLALTAAALRARAMEAGDG